MRVQKFADGSRTALTCGSTDFARSTRLVAPSELLSNLSSCVIWPCSLMRVAWQYFLWTSIPTYTAILILHLRSFLVGLNAAITYSRARAHSRGRSRSLPIHTPDRFRSCGSRAYQPRRTFYVPRTRDFSSIHTRNEPDRQRSESSAIVSPY